MEEIKNVYNEHDEIAKDNIEQHRDHKHEWEEEYTDSDQTELPKKDRDEVLLEF